MDIILNCRITDLYNLFKSDGNKLCLWCDRISYNVVGHTSIDNVSITCIACLQNMYIYKFITIQYGLNSLLYVFIQHEKQQWYQLFSTNHTFHNFTDLIDTYKFVKFDYQSINSDCINDDNFTQNTQNVWIPIPDHTHLCVKDLLVTRNIKSVQYRE